MDFALNDEQAMIAETARQFFADNATSERVRRAMAADGFDRETWRSFCQELGLGGLLTPEKFGGSGLGMVEFATVAEAAGAQVAAIPLLGQAMVSSAIVAGGTDDQRSEWLGRIASGETVAAFAESAALTCEDDRLTGRIDFVAHGNVADLFLIAGSTGAWLVEAKAEGVSVDTPTTMDQTRPLATVTLDQAAAISFADGAAALAAAQTSGWICLAAEALGGAQECLDRTVAYAKERVQFGRAIGSFQAYKHRLADMMVEIEQTRSAVYWAACAVDEQSDDPALALHAAKSFAADTYFKCAADMIQLHGGIGFTWEHDAHLFFKRARSIQTLLHGGNWHREQVAEMILGDAA